MHVPDGFIDAPVSLAAGVVAVGGIAYCIKQGSQSLDEKQVPMAGMVAAFIFAVQMLNFPVASRHQRAPARRVPGRDAGRAVPRGAGGVGGAARAGPAVRRRRAERPRPQHRQHGPRAAPSCGYALFRLAAPAPAQGQRRRHRGLGRRGVRVSVVSRRSSSALVLPARRRGLGVGRDGARRHGRRPHPDRHRRRHHHGAHRRRGAGGAARPGLRRPRPAARAASCTRRGCA